MPLTLSPLQLEDFWIDEMEIRTPPRQPSLPGVKEETRMKIDLGVETLENADDASEFLSTLKMELKGDPSDSGEPAKEPPYTVRIVLTGKFAVHSEMEKETLANLKTLNAPAILYGVARGIVACATGMGTRGRLPLPTVNIASIYDEKKTPASAPLLKATRRRTKKKTLDSEPS